MTADMLSYTDNTKLVCGPNHWLPKLTSCNSKDFVYQAAGTYNLYIVDLNEQSKQHAPLSN